MAGKSGPETKLIAKMRKAASEEYGDRLVVIKHHGSMYSEDGVSDLLCCIDGVFVACEVKAPESYGNSVEKALAKGPTVKQLAFGARVKATGGMFAVVATVEQFMEVLWNAICYAEYETYESGARYE